MLYQVSWDFSSEVVSITIIEYVYQTHMRFIFHHTNHNLLIIGYLRHEISSTKCDLNEPM